MLINIAVIATAHIDKLGIVRFLFVGKLHVYRHFLPDWMNKKGTKKIMVVFKCPIINDS